MDYLLTPEEIDIAIQNSMTVFVAHIAVRDAQAEKMIKAGWKSPQEYNKAITNDTKLWLAERADTIKQVKHEAREEALREVVDYMGKPCGGKHVTYHNDYPDVGSYEATEMTWAEAHLPTPPRYLCRVCMSTYFTALKSGRMPKKE